MGFVIFNLEKNNVVRYIATARFRSSNVKTTTL